MCRAGNPERLERSNENPPGMTPRGSFAPCQQTCDCCWWISIALVVTCESVFRLPAALGVFFSMPDQSESTTEYVRITIDLERDLLDWIDGLCKQTGFRSRGLIISQLIRELIDDLDKETEISPSVSDGQASQHP